MQKQTIQADVVAAMKSGQRELAEVLRGLVAAISQKEKDKRYSFAQENPGASEDELVREAALSEEEMVSALAAEVKKRKDAIALYEQGGRPELAEKETGEIAIIQKYLPEQIAQEELIAMVQQAVAETGAKEMKDMGKVMGLLNPKIKGRADSSEVSKLVKELLSK